METGNIFIRHWTDIFQGLRKNTSIHMEMHMIWQSPDNEKLMDMFRKDAPKMELSMIQMSVSGISS